MPILSRLNSILLGTESWRRFLTDEALSSGWCGQAPATESEILEAERRLGLTLPPSYRSFLLFSNGWRPFSNSIERLLPVSEIERFRDADPEDVALIQELYADDDVTDSDYLDYETPEHKETLRSSYYPDSILIGKKWQSGGGELLLLNPQIVFPNGEWEAIFFANWIPGNERFRSFRDLTVSFVESAERFEAAGPH